VAALQSLGQQHVGTAAWTHVYVDEAASLCPSCSGAMRVQKTVRRLGITLEHGAFTARQSVYVCAAGCRHPDGSHVTRRPATLGALLPPRGRAGYDVIVRVGLLRFVEHRQRDEIRDVLQTQHGITLSTGAISALSHRFLLYLEALHEARAPELRAALAHDGGWPLHIDATGEDGRGTLLVAFTSWRGWVLGAWKVPTERADALLPRLRTVVERFGPPCALIRDLGRAVTEAGDDLVAGLPSRIPVLACHLHFLRDVGGDLLRPAHDQMRGLMRRFKIKSGLRALARDLGRALGQDIGTARQGLCDWQMRVQPGHALPEGAAGLACVRALAQWVLDSPADGSDAGFPFDLPYLDLYRRCRTASRAADAFTRRPITDAAVRKALKRLRRLLRPVDSEVPFERCARTLRTRAALFVELRDALRLRPKPAGRNTPSLSPPPDAPPAATELRNIEAAVDALTASLAERRPARGPAQDQRQAVDILLAHLQRHSDSLFGHLIALPESAGGGVRPVERTNNCLEGFFDDFKHGERRRSGRKRLAQDLEQMPAAAALAANLRVPDYVEIVCGSHDALPRAFAALDANDTRRSAVVARAAARLADASDCDIVSASLPLADRALIRTEEMNRRIRAAASSRAPRQ
jgi:hypothetical protein